MSNSYGVVWREANDHLARGSLELLPRALRLDGMAGCDRAGRELRYADLAAVHVGRGAAERIDGRPSLVLQPRLGPPISIASVAEPGAIGELADRLGALRLGHVGRRTAVVVPLRAGSHDAVQALVAAGPPFDPEEIGLAQHEVFLTPHEAVFVFDSPLGAAAIESLLARPEIWERAGAWHEHVAGPPRIAAEAYSWTRAEAEPDLFLVPPGLR
jgi:hypothetical protein